MAKKEKWESEMVPGVGFTEPTYTFIHCETVEKSRLFEMNLATGTNCAIESVGKPVKCKLWNLDKECVESVHMYDNSKPTYPKKKKRKK